MRYTFQTSLTALPLAALLLGCFEQSAQAPESETASQSESRNNSDPTKPGFSPDLQFPKVETAYQDRLDRTPGYKGLQEYQSRPSPEPLAKSASDQRWVGVLPRYQAGWNACPASKRVWIKQDDEDSNNESRTGGSLSFGAIDTDARNTTLYFCKVPGTSLTGLKDYYYTDGTRSASDYAVLKLDDQCPEGSKQFGVYIDNEDDHNANANSGNIWPNVQQSSVTTLYFCMFKTVPQVPEGTFLPGLPELDYLQKDYAVFTYPNTDHIYDYFIFPSQFFYYSGWVYSDDEDDDNLNKFIFDGLTEDERTRARRIVDHGASRLGTKYHFSIPRYY